MVRADACATADRHRRLRRLGQTVVTGRCEPNRPRRPRLVKRTTGLEPATSSLGSDPEGTERE